MSKFSVRESKFKNVVVEPSITQRNVLVGDISTIGEIISSSGDGDIAFVTSTNCDINVQCEDKDGYTLNTSSVIHIY
jgi:hypothetical protein